MAGDIPLLAEERILRIEGIEPYIIAFVEQEFYSKEYFEALLNVILASYE